MKTSSNGISRRDTFRLLGAAATAAALSPASAAAQADAPQLKGRIRQ